MMGLLGRRIGFAMVLRLINGYVCGDEVDDLKLFNETVNLLFDLGF